MPSFFREDRVKSVDVNDLEESLGKISLIDIRESDQYEEGHLPTAKNIPMYEILREPDEYLNKDKEYHIICRSGRKSSFTCNELMLKGFKVINVSGGTIDYRGKLEKE